MNVTSRSTSHASLKGFSSVCNFGVVELITTLFAESAEAFVRLDFVLELACHAFNHNRIVDVADARDAVGDEVFQVCKIREYIEDTGTIPVLRGANGGR